MRAALLIVALAFPGCEQAKQIDGGIQLLATPAAPQVGDLVQLAFEPTSDTMQKALLDEVEVQPPGLLVEEQPGSYRVVAPGRVWLGVDVAGDRFELPAGVWLDIACPPTTDAEVVHQNEVIADDASWTASEGRHRIEGEVRVEGGTLTLGACVSIEMGSGAALIVGENAPGRLLVRGSADHPVRMTGSDWQGVRIFANRATGSEIRHLELHDARGFANADSAALDLVGDRAAGFSWSSDWVLAGVVVRDCAGVGIRIRDYLVMENPTWTGARVEGCAGYPASVDPVSLGAVPQGRFEENQEPYVELLGGQTGPFGAVVRDPGVPFRVADSLHLRSWDGFDYPDWLPIDTAARRVPFVLHAGVRLEFERGGIYVGGGPRPVVFQTWGNRLRPVVLTSAAATPAPGDWVGVVFTADALMTALRDGLTAIYTSTLHGAIIEYAGGVPEAPVDPLRQAAVFVDHDVMFNLSQYSSLLEGATVRHSAGFGLSATSSTFPFTDRTFTTRRNGVPSCLCGNAWGRLFSIADAQPCTDPTECASGQACIGPTGATVCGMQPKSCPCTPEGPWPW